MAIKKPLISIPLGILIGAIGKIKDREDWNMLSHYLLANGKSYKLSNKFQELFDNTKEKEFLVLNNSNKNIGFIEVHEGKSIEFYQCVGKFFYTITENKIYITDTYEFYPWCGSWQHFNGCDCSKKEWNYKQFGFDLTFRLKNYLRDFAIDIEYFSMDLVCLGEDLSVLSLDIKDSFWAGLGCPFETTGEFYLPKLE